MKKLFLPTYIASSARSITPSFYKAIGKKIVLFDLDNTLDPVDVAEPTSETIAFIKELKKEGIKVYVASNNTGKRVSRYCDKLGIEATSGLMKPFSFKLRKWIKKNGYDKEEIILVGDQIFTDVIAAKGAGIDVILTEPISKKDSVFTWLNRKMEKPIRKKIKNRGLCKQAERKEK